MNASTILAHDYKLPPELLSHINSGLLTIVAENWDEKTVEFHVPRFRSTDLHDRITCYIIIWIHPDHNAEFCHYFHEKPGDLPNFYVTREMMDTGEEQLEINTVDDLVAWLDDPSTV